MLIPNQTIKMKWHPSNKRWYQDKGYNYTKIGETFYVTPQDLPHGSHAQVGFICDYCGKKSYVDFHTYISRNLPFGEYKCIKCYNKYMSDYSLQKRQNDIYNRVLQSCDKHGYRCLTPKEQIINVDSMIRYLCPIHGEKKRRAHLFIYGDHICPECNKENKMLSVQEVCKRIALLGGKLLNPEEYKGSQKSNLRIICRSCGQEFVTSYNSFVCIRDGDGQRCPLCVKKQSAGEYRVGEFLVKRGIEFVFQKSFENCRDERPLPFDFFLPKYNSVIEYDGAQHFIPVRFHSETYDLNRTDEEILSYVQKHDCIKDSYCNNNGIKILRIKYQDYNKVEQIISDFLCLHDDIV